MSAPATKPNETVTDPYKEFDAVLGELDAFHKAITASPTEPAQVQPQAQVQSNGGGSDKKPEPQPSMLEKALQGGQGMELDGEAVMKALSADLQTMVKGATVEIVGAMAMGNKDLMKGQALFCKALEMQGQIIKAQDLKIEALSEDIAALGGKPRMRKSVLNVHERGQAGAAQETAKTGTHPDDACTREEFMEKAVNAGIGGAMVSVCRQHLHLFPEKSIKEAIPPHIYAAVMKESKAA